jgi:type IV pilus assembly protein PilM
MDLMARSGHVWGIDIGTCGLKALRCTAGADDKTVEGVAYEYIEYPMLLSDPEADRVELVRNALQELLSRHDLHPDKVVLSVPGQSGLTKYSKLPPIEAKKIPDIVAYEARQQIPFPLDQVVWDWQRLPGGMEEAGFVIDAEVAIFAMKREQVFKALQPLTDSGIEVEILQLAPVALANMVMFDQLPPSDELDPDDPPPFTVLVSTGVDSTDLVVTNGLQIWQRSIPIGGSNFTKAIVAAMKLTFSKAEHLKRNAVRAENAKEVFMAMRPVFNDFSAELQRSLNYFTGTHKTAKIGKVFLLGNAVKLRGLSDFVAKQIGLDVTRLEKFEKLEGASVIASPVFRENRLAFGTAYGLAAQGLGLAEMKTTLMPKQILRDRLIASKRPMTVAALLLLMTAAFIGYAGNVLTLRSYAESVYKPALDLADRAASSSQAAKSAVQKAEQDRDAAVQEQQIFLTAAHRRFQTLEMLRALRSVLPHDPPDAIPEDPADRTEVHIDTVEMQYFSDLSKWFKDVEDQWAKTHPRDGIVLDEPEPEETPESAEVTADGEAGEKNEAEGEEAEASPSGSQSSATPDPATVASDDARGELIDDPGPSGPGWVIELRGHHFHNEDRHKPNQSAQFLRDTLIKNLLGEGPQVTVDVGPLAGRSVSVREFGIGYPVMVQSSTIRPVEVVNELLAAKGGVSTGVGMMGPDSGMMGMGSGMMGMGSGMMGMGSGRMGMGSGRMGMGSGRMGMGGYGSGSGQRPPRGSGGEEEAAGAEDGEEAENPVVELKQYDFVVQFCWVPMVPGSPDLEAGDASGGAGRASRRGGGSRVPGGRSRSEDD